MGVLFWLVVAALSLLAVVFAAGPWLRPNRQLGADDRHLVNVAVHRQRLAELEADRRAGRIDETAFDAMLQEEKAALLADATQPEPTAAPAASAPDKRSWRTVGAIALVVPALAVPLYWVLGAADDLAFAKLVAEAEATPTGHSDTADQMAPMLAALEARLQQEPNDADGWFLLGRSALSIKDYDRAVAAFRRVVALAEGAPSPLVYLAQAEYLAADRTITPAARETIQAVLALVPDEPIMLELLAVEAFGQGRYRDVIDLLQRGLAKGVDAERRGFFELGIERARAQLGEPAGAPSVALGSGSEAAAAGGVAAIVDLALAPQLAVPSDAIVFVTAKLADGPPMPLAVARHRVGDLPRSVRLDASAAMSPAMQLKAGQEVIISARIARSGSVERRADDIEVTSARLQMGDAPQRLAMTFGGPDGVGWSDGAPSVAPRAIGAGRMEAGSNDVSAGLQVRVLVEAGKSVQIDQGATLFVFARASGGPPMPVAVARQPAALPALVTLTDDMAMVPGRTLSTVGPIELVARISQSGGALASSGDWEGQVAAFDPRSTQRVIPLLVDRLIP